MELSKTYPLWIGGPMVLGGSMLSTFAARLNEFWQDIGLYTGIFLVALGVLGFFWNAYKGSANIIWSLPPRLLVPLLDASTTAFEKLKQSKWHVDELDNNGKDVRDNPGLIFSYYAKILVKELSIYGQTYPSQETVLIDKILIDESNHVATDCTQILTLSGESKYTNLKIAKRDLKAFIYLKKDK